jgi:hypothetical protein
MIAKTIYPMTESEIKQWFLLLVWRGMVSRATLDAGAHRRGCFHRIPERRGRDYSLRATPP